MDVVNFITKILIGTVLGAIIGSEREKVLKQRIVGLRTFALLSLLGSFFGLLSLSAIPFGEFFPLVGLIAIIAYTYFVYKSARLKVGMVTLVALPLTYLIGLLVGFDYTLQATASTFIMLAVLLVGRSLHKHVEKLRKEEINEIIQFGLILFVLYPILPKEPVVIAGISIDFVLFFFIILFISLINFAAFLINRLTNKKATMLSGFLCGVINSTATIYFFSKMSKEKNKNYIAGATAAIIGSISRNALLAAVLLTEAFIRTIYFFVAALLILIFFLYIEKKEMKLKFPAEQPFTTLSGTAIAIALFSGTTLFQLLSTRFPIAIIPAAFLGSTVSTTLVLLSLSASAYLMPMKTVELAIISAIGGSLITDIAAAFIHRSKKFFNLLLLQIILLLLLVGVFIYFFR